MQVRKGWCRWTKRIALFNRIFLQHMKTAIRTGVNFWYFSRIKDYHRKFIQWLLPFTQLSSSLIIVPLRVHQNCQSQILFDSLQLFHLVTSIIHIKLFQLLQAYQFTDTFIYKKMLEKKRLRKVFKTDVGEVWKTE